MGVHGQVKPHRPVGVPQFDHIREPVPAGPVPKCVAPCGPCRRSCGQVGRVDAPARERQDASAVTDPWQGPELCVRAPVEGGVSGGERPRQVGWEPGEEGMVWAADEAHLLLLHQVRSCWILRGRRPPRPHPGQGPSGHGAGRGRGRHWPVDGSAQAPPRGRLHRAAAVGGSLTRRAVDRGGLRQRQHPPHPDGPAVRGRSPGGASVVRGALQPRRQPGRADLGGASPKRSSDTRRRNRWR